MSSCLTAHQHNTGYSVPLTVECWNDLYHIRRYHGDDDENEGSESDVFNFPESSSTLVQNCTADSPCQTNTGDTAISHVDWLDTIKLEGASLVAGLRAKGYIPSE